MPRNRSRDRKAGGVIAVRPVLGAALAGLMVCAGTVAARAGDNDSILTSIERTIGLKSPNTMEYGINYSERSPLVVPPTRDLPPPETGAPQATANWPKDPDIQAKDKAKVADKVVPHPDHVIDSGRPLRPDELNSVYGHPGSSGGGSSPSDPADDRYYKSASGTSLWNGLFKTKTQGEYATFTGEPTRSTLTDPPPGYMTPSPDQPYGLGPDRQTTHVTTASEHGELGR
jgi:hypothetical protein